MNFQGVPALHMRGTILEHTPYGHGKREFTELEFFDTTMVQIRTMWTENQQLNSDIRRSLYKEELVLEEIKMQVFVRCIHRRVFDMEVIIAAEYEVRMRCFRGENPATQRWYRQFIRNHLTVYSTRQWKI